jgi:hypothetical protein
MRHHPAVAALLAALLLPPAIAAAQTSKPAAAKAASKERCVKKAGEATGITRGFAEYEALLIIRQVTGNWPVETDRIANVKYDCKPGAAVWTCRAQAEVCKR